MVEEAMRIAGLAPNTSPAAPGGNGQQPAMFAPNDATNSGEATVPLLTQPLRPTRPRAETIGPGQGGRPSGTFPGQPSGQGT